MKSDKISRSLQALEHAGVVHASAASQAPSILQHQQKADGIKAQLTARHDIDEMLDSGLMVAKPRKVAATLVSTEKHLANELKTAPTLSTCNASTCSSTQMWFGSELTCKSALNSSTQTQSWTGHSTAAAGTRVGEGPGAA